MQVGSRGQRDSERLAVIYHGELGKKRCRCHSASSSAVILSRTSEDRGQPEVTIILHSASIQRLHKEAAVRRPRVLI